MSIIVCTFVATKLLNMENKIISYSNTKFESLSEALIVIKCDLATSDIVAKLIGAIMSDAQIIVQPKQTESNG